eukprot:CAMPEP_0174862684 /NCGR_PEP_ID=MMETSP1114-20130205/54665_1 /TAXON_ID=312471 /ORGANISM="Neobodo designis, Strain CCAP 1951/1" /LENGTH=56 /DNA_ID=CAMNT_0016097737 /DNA_START=61 /DNA_END=227 /DNA_ORIENTATION=-
MTAATSRRYKAPARRVASPTLRMRRARNSVATPGLWAPGGPHELPSGVRRGSVRAG